MNKYRISNIILFLEMKKVYTLMMNGLHIMTLVKNLMEKYFN